MRDPLTLIHEDGTAEIHTDFLPAPLSRSLMDTFISTIPWRREELTLFGRKVLTPRLSSWHGDAAYTYSGMTMVPNPWTGELLDLKARIERLGDAAYNSVLLNLYRDGRDSMGWHSDDEPELGENPTIASISLGEPRRFRFRHRTDKRKTVAADLPDGSLLVMSGPLQHHWQHAVGKTARKVGPRVNLTFRWTAPSTD